MKNYIYLLTAVCVLALAGCSKEEVKYDDSSSIKILTSDRDFPTAGGKGVITYSITDGAYADVKVKSSRTWLTIDSATDGRVEFSVSESSDAFARSGDITIGFDDDKQVVTVLQSGLVFGFDQNGKTINLDPTGVTVQEIPYTSSGIMPSFLGVPEWLNVEAVLDVENPREGVIIFDAELNLTNTMREATIEIGNIWKEVKVYVRQDAASGTGIAKFNCDASACTSDPIVIAEYAKSALGNWSVESGDDWLTVNKSGDSFTISVMENTTGAVRKGGVRLLNGINEVVATLKVEQTDFNIDSVGGLFEFVSNNWWNYGMTIVKDEKRANGLKASLLNSDGKKISEGTAIKLDYVPYGEAAPKILMKVPQNLGLGIDYNGAENNMKMTALTEGYYLALDECHYEMTYIGENGSKMFKAVPGEDAIALYGGGLIGLFFHPVDEYTGIILEHVPEYGGFILKEWDGYSNHDDFMDN